MSFYSELTRAGQVTNRHVRRKTKHAEALERNAKTLVTNRASWRRQQAKIDAAISEDVKTTKRARRRRRG